MFVGQGEQRDQQGDRTCQCRDEDNRCPGRNLMGGLCILIGGQLDLIGGRLHADFKRLELLLEPRQCSHRCGPIRAGKADDLSCCFDVGVEGGLDARKG